LGRNRDAFIALRNARDATLPMPRLIIPSLQVNMRAGQMPPADKDGKTPLTKGRILLLHIDNARKGREVLNLLRARGTTARRWPSERRAVPDAQIRASRPEVTLNLAFTFWGLAALQVPIRTLRGMPDEFAEGMAARAAVLGDRGPSAPSNWDQVWKHDGPDAVHVMVTLNAQMQNELSIARDVHKTLIPKSTSTRTRSVSTR
jgi:hypothetical protein